MTIRRIITIFASNLRRMTTYIHQLKNWPEFIWKNEALLSILAKVNYRQGRIRAYMETLGFSDRNEKMLETLTQDVLKSTEIEGEKLDPEKVRSSIARRLGLDVAGLVPSHRNVDGVVEMMVDATRNFNQPLTKDRLCGWQSALFPGGRSGIGKIIVGDWRDDSTGPMQVVSGPMGKEKVHYEAPSANNLEEEMHKFLTWFETKDPTSPVLKAAIAHLWYVTIHPFEDGNGRIARAIADMQLTRVDGNSKRFYSMTTQIEADKNSYYDVLEKTQKGTLDITEWLEWFLNCLDRALSKTEQTIDKVLEKARFWDKHSQTLINERQRSMVNKMLDGIKGNMNSSKWAKMAKCSADTALRDIEDLIGKGMLKKGHGGGRSTNYILKPIEMEYKLTDKEEGRKIEFLMEKSGSYIAIKQILLTPLFNWTKPDEWSAKLAEQNLKIKVNWEDTSTHSKYEQFYDINSYNNPYYFEPRFSLSYPIIIPTDLAGRLPQAQVYPVKGTIEIWSSTPDIDFNVTLIYDETTT